MKKIIGRPIKEKEKQVKIVAAIKSLERQYGCELVRLVGTKHFTQLREQRKIRLQIKLAENSLKELKAKKF